MPIPESQLERWAEPQQTRKAQYTHKVIREAIKNYDYSRKYEFEDYLQGSYANHTNIWADTDVDIVVQLNSVFRSDISNLTSDQQEIYNSVYTTASYGLSEFKPEVISALREKFGYFKVETGNKSVKVLPDDSGNRYKADIVIALQYRLYVPTRGKNTTFDSKTGLYYYEGIWFKASSGEEIINYPKLHLKNGADKNQRTNSKFKPIVRIFKNMRNTAYDKGYLYDKNLAPSYFVQCLLYNVPNEIYMSNSYQEIIEKLLSWLIEAYDEGIFSDFVSQNGIVPLFGSGSDKWNEQDAIDFLTALTEMWDEW